MLSTVTGNVNTILGIAVSRGVVNFSLAGYGSAHVAISGATDSPIGPVNSAPIQPDGSFTIQVHSNDSITPSGTVYLVSFSTDIGTFGAFSFAIIGNSVNLNTAVPQAPGISFTTSTAFSNGLVLYVSTSGNDSNDGKSWATAKLTLYGAVTSLPGGSSTQAGVGVIYVSDGVNAHPNAGTGLWIMGPNDPNFGSLPAGWIKAPSGFVSIVGVQSRNYGPNPHIGRAAINLGGNGVGKGSNPVFWFSSVTGGGINIENIFAQNGNQGFRIGVDSNGAITNAPSGCAGMTFVNCSANSQNSSLPAWTIAGESFWIEVIDCGGQGNIGTGGLTAQDDNAQAFLIDGRGSSGGQIINFRGYTNLSLGGIKFYTGSNDIGQISIEDCTEEGAFAATSPVAPILWIATGGHGVMARVGSALIADGGIATMAAVQNDGTAQVFVNNAWGVGINTQGPVIQSSDFGNNYQNQIVSPQRNGQAGFFGGWSTQLKRVVGQIDDSRRQFVSLARFVNVAPTNPANWSTFFGAIATGIAAPDGTLNAGRISTTQGFASGAQFFRSNISYSVGDWIVIGGWVRSNSGNGTIAQPIQCNLVTSGFTFAGGAASLNAGAFIQGDGEWEFLIGLAKIATIGTNPCDTEFLGLTDSTHTEDIYGPAFLHIPTGTISDNEVYALAMSLVSQRADALAGNISIPAGTSFLADSLRMPKIITAIAAPGADFGFLRWEAGTNAGTLKLVAYAGTSTTGVTVADNIGAGN